MLISKDFLPVPKLSHKFMFQDRVYSLRPESNRKKSQSYKTQEIVKLQNFIIFFHLCRNLVKKTGFGLFWFVCLGFVFKAVLLEKVPDDPNHLASGIGISIYLSTKKEKLQYSEKLVKLICHKTAPHTPSLT